MKKDTLIICLTLLIIGISNAWTSNLIFYGRLENQPLLFLWGYFIVLIVIYYLMKKREKMMFKKINCILLACTLLLCSSSNRIIAYEKEECSECEYMNFENTNDSGIKEYPRNNRLL